jgi:hypothetical protein
MGVFKSVRDLQKQAKEMQRNAPPVGERMAAMQDKLTAVNEMMARQTQAANAAARAASGVGGPVERTPVVITGMRQIGTMNFDLLVEFELTVTPEGMPPYPATIEQLVSQFQVSQLQAGRTLLATIDSSNPAAIWLDFSTVSG